MDDCHSAEVEEDGWDDSRLLTHLHEQIESKPTRHILTDLGADDEPHRLVTLLATESDQGFGETMFWNSR